MINSIIHEWPDTDKPKRVIILGKSGFVAGSIIRRLKAENLEVVAIGSDDIDLIASDAGEKLAAHITTDDVLIFVSAVAPSKTRDLYSKNMLMVEAVCQALEKTPVAHLINISSDAIYVEDADPVSESSPTAPGNLHGMTHAVREMLLNLAYTGPIISLRPSLLYGNADPHNGYGPNKFQRLAKSNEQITLFGKGEEKRDHVFIEDVADLVYLAIIHRSKGILNIATGESTSFREVAEMAIKIHNSNSTIQETKRQNPVTHRHFNIDNSIKFFPNFIYSTLQDGLTKVINHQR
jgi:UDP-glucose 4-epimerase